MDCQQPCPRTVQADILRHASALRHSPFASHSHRESRARPNRCQSSTLHLLGRQSCCKGTGRPTRWAVVAAAGEASDKQERRKVVILGGTGRVGSSTAVALLRLDPHLDIVVGSRSRESYAAAVKKRPDLNGAKFEEVRANWGVIQGLQFCYLVFGCDCHFQLISFINGLNGVHPSFSTATSYKISVYFGTACASTGKFTASQDLLAHFAEEGERDITICWPNQGCLLNPQCGSSTVSFHRSQFLSIGDHHSGRVRTS